MRGQFSSGAIVRGGAIILGGNCPGGQFLGAIIQGAIIRGTIFLGGNCPKTCSRLKRIKREGGGGAKAFKISC